MTAIIRPFHPVRKLLRMSTVHWSNDIFRYVGKKPRAWKRRLDLYGLGKVGWIEWAMGRGSDGSLEAGRKGLKRS